jgi:hypothetical protein
MRLLTVAWLAFAWGRNALGAILNCGHTGSFPSLDELWEAVVAARRLWPAEIPTRGPATFCCATLLYGSTEELKL